MSKQCPKCGYIRKPSDLAPDYECPKCGVVYSKVEKKASDEGPANHTNSDQDAITRNRPGGEESSERENEILAEVVSLQPEENYMLVKVKISLAEDLNWVGSSNCRIDFRQESLLDGGLSVFSIVLERNDGRVWVY